VLGAGCALAVLLVAAVSGQEPETALRSQDSMIRGWIRDKKALSPDEIQQMTRYCQNYLFPQLTSKASQGRLPQVRQKIRAQFFNAAPNGPPHDLLNDLAFAWMRAVAGKNTNPQVVRYNAMLVIADLDSDGGPPPKPSKPYAPALKLLLTVVQNSRLPGALQVAAMYGVKRHAASHASFPLSPQDQAAIVTAVGEVLRQTTLAPGATADSQRALRLDSGQVLLSLSDAAGKNVPALTTAVQRLAADVSDSQAILAHRYEAARLLGDLPHPRGAALDYGQLADVLGQLVEGSVRDELRRSGEQLPSRRKLRYCANSVWLSLKGSDGQRGLEAAAAGTPHASAVAAVAAKVQPVWKLVNDLKVSDEELSERLQPLLTQLAAAPRALAEPVGTRGASPPAAAVGQDDFDQIEEPAGPAAALQPVSTPDPR
jgi:hypothetical protein